MSLFNLSLLLILPAFGWVVLKTFIGINSVIYLLPFSFVFGLSAFLFLIYSLSYFLGIQQSALLSVFIMLIIAVILSLVFRKQFLKIENPLKIKEILILLFICIFILFFTSLISIKWIVWDFKFHISVASYLVSSDKFPGPVSNWPSLFIPYHYGFNVLSAAIVKLSGISVINSFRFIVVISSFVTFLSCFSLAYFILDELMPSLQTLIPKQKYEGALMGALCFYFAGNLLWLDALIRYLFKIFPVDKTWSFIQTMLGIGIHGSIISDMASGGVLFASITLGIQFFLVLLFLFLKYLFNSSVSLKYLISIFIVSVALFHNAEWILYIFLLMLIMSPFLSYIFKDQIDLKTLLIKNSICVLLIILIIFFNGIAYKVLSSEYSYMPNFLELTMNPKFFMLRTFGRFGNLNQHRDLSLFSWDFLSEFGLQLIFSGFVIFWLIKNKVKVLSVFISIILVSFISPFFLYIKSSPPDVLRLFHPGYELLSLFFALWIFDLRFKAVNFITKNLTTLVVPMVILPPLFTLILSGIFSPAIYLNYPFIGFVDNSVKELFQDKDFGKFCKNINEGLSLMKEGSVRDSADVKVASYLKSNLKENEFGLSGNPFPFDLTGIPCYSALRGSSLMRRITYVTLMRTLDPYLLKELNIKWLYLEPKTQEIINLDLVNELIKNNLLTEVLSVNSIVYGQAKLYKFIDLEKQIELYPRKAYWAFFVYFTQNIIPIPDSNGNQIVYLFNTEKEATGFLKEQIKTNPDFKTAKPFIDAVDEKIIQGQAKLNNLVVKYIN